MSKGNCDIRSRDLATTSPFVSCRDFDRSGLIAPIPRQIGAVS
jgi:hypothetical protein